MFHRLVSYVLCRANCGRNWFRCALAALALGYAAESIAGNGPYWEPDVSYLHWSTDVPAVTVCRKLEDEKSSPKYSEIDNTLMIKVLKQTTEFKKKDNFYVCKKLFKNCSWNEKHFNCCRHFQPHRFVVEKPCFAINSMQTINKRKKLVVSHFSYVGELKMEFNEPVEILLQDPTDIRFGELQNPYLQINTNEKVELLYTSRQIIEDASLSTLDFSKRGCLLRDEKKLIHHSVYSKSACLLECALHKPELYVKNISLCDCHPTCTAMEINTIWNGTQRSIDNDTRCILTMSKPATERLVMKAKKDFIDLIVIVACLLQLFTGVSLLEIPNYILNNKKTRNN